MLGQTLWNQFLAAEKENPESAPATLERCKKQLSAALDGLKAEQVNDTTMMSSLLLAKALIRSNKHTEALGILENKASGPLERMQGPNALVPGIPGFAADTYRTALQALVTQLTAGGDASALLEKAQKLTEQMRSALAGQPGGQKTMVSIYYSLAQDIKKKIEVAPPGQRDKLISAFKLFLSDLGKQATDPTTVHWVAQTFIEMGKSAMGDAKPPAQGLAKELLEESIVHLQNLLDDDPGEAEAVRQIRFELATTSRLMGNYKQAIDALEKILQEKNTMIDAQVEAALSYQQWAEVINPKFAKKAFSSAMSGARPGANGKNTIWGWGKIAKLAQGNAAFNAVFFDARYRIAECRHLIGQRSPVATDKKKYADLAEKDITMVFNLYPGLGGAESKTRYDGLLRKIQIAQNKQPTGLPAPPQPKQPAAGNN